MKLLTAGVIGILVFVSFQILNKDTVNKKPIQFGVLIQLLWLIRFILIYGKLDFDQTPPAFYIIYDQTLIFLDGPLFWLYTRSLIDPEGFKKKDWLHFVPFFVLFLYSTYLLIIAPDAIRNEYEQAVNNMLKGNPMADFYDSIFIVVALGISLIYVFKAVRIARLYNSSLMDNYSSVDNRKANWIIIFQRLWIVLFFIPSFIYFILYIFPFIPPIYIAGIVLVSLMVLSVFFSFNLLNQSYVPVKSLNKKNKPAIDSPQQVDSEQTARLEMLKRELEKEQYYVDEDLSLNKLANHVDLKPAELTELIKLSEFENFYDLINSYRIEEIKKQLVATDEQIIILAYQNGYKSKSTFNKIFKEKTGLTPKAYRIKYK